MGISTFRNITILTAVASTIFLGGCAGPPRRAVGGQVVTPDEPPPDYDNVLEGLVEANNHERTEADLPPLKVNAKLEAAAKKHAKDMAEHKKMDHKGSDGSTPFERMEAEGYHYRRAGENIAYGRFTLERLMKGWMDSP